jgi:uncharacterized protein YcaQ
VRERALAAFLRDDAVVAATVEGVRWLWPAEEAATSGVPERVHALAPFDPVVWDRRRFALFWGFDYRLEAYTPPAKRRFGYYALPLLWRDRVVGWLNATLRDGRLTAAAGYADGTPRERAFRRELEAEVARRADAVGARDYEVER